MDELDRRGLLGFGCTLGALGAAGALSGHAGAATGDATTNGPYIDARAYGVRPGSIGDMTKRLQRAIDRAAARQLPLRLAPGTYRTKTLELRLPGALLGASGATKLQSIGSGPLVRAGGVRGVVLEGLVLSGDVPAPGKSSGEGLIDLRDCTDVAIADCRIVRAASNGIVLRASSGSVRNCGISECGEAGLISHDARGMEIAGNRVNDCRNNGIQVWRATPGEDGSRIVGNWVGQIAAASGGSGQNGNGINLFRANSVLVANNRLSDCAFSAIRANQSSNCQIIANSCERLGEVAIYAEFAFEGVVIANNLVDRAATGIVVTNFNEGGRLGVVQGNLVRNLFRREADDDKRGNGITVEADCSVTGNVIENAPTVGLHIGWGVHLRDVVANGNLIRASRFGIGVSRDVGADGRGKILIANNLISGASAGAIYAFDHDRPVGDDLSRSTRAPGSALVLAGNAVG